MGTSGGPGKVDNLESVDKLATIATTFLKRSGWLFRQAKPLIAESSAQQLEALKTGGVGARIPMIQRAVEASKAATAGALKGTSDEMASSGIAGTPFGASILAATRMSGEQATSQIPTNIASGMLAQPATGIDTIRASLGFGGAGINAQQAGAGLDLNRQEFNSAQFASFMKDLKDTASSAYGGAGKCWIAAALYGFASTEFFAARSWIFLRWQGPIAVGVRWLYLRLGQRVARFRRARELLRPLFDRAVQRGLEAT